MMLWKVVSSNQAQFKNLSRTISAFLAVYVAAVSSSKDPIAIVKSALFGWILALLTNNKAIYYWSAGMMATISQGIAHDVAGELGTLQVLQDDALDQTSYELSHVTFFP